jgi:Xaa-Pro dipeptidase
MGEIEHNIKLGIKFSKLLQRAYPVLGELQQNAYPCILHGVGMCDEYSHIYPIYRGTLPYDETLQAGMVFVLKVTWVQWTRDMGSNWSSR